MQSLKDRIAQADTLLAPYAVPHGGVLGRTFEEPADKTRFPFQRDRDRIIHTLAFRRLKGKTQVFVTTEAGDHERTRLTHTLEVAQIGRDIARSLQLNEDLTEAIALAHDLGHPPFGHAGEKTLDIWMQEYGQHFEHNEQSHRIVTTLEKHSSLYSGLNLNQEILNGLLKHTTPHDAPISNTAAASPKLAVTSPKLRELRARACGVENPSLEAQVVNLADEIAYTGHDCEDGLRASLFPFRDLLEIDLAREADTLRAPRGTSLRGAIIHMLVSDLLQSFDASSSHIAFSPSMVERLAALRHFLEERMYRHKDVQEKNRKGQEIVATLLRKYAAGPPKQVTTLMEQTGGTLEEAVKDYVCGMTDRYAENQINAR